MDTADIVKIIDEELLRLRSEPIWTDAQLTANEAEIYTCERLKRLITNELLRQSALEELCEK